MSMGIQGAVNFALMMSQMEGGCPVDYNTITDLFLQVCWHLPSSLKNMLHHSPLGYKGDEILLLFCFPVHQRNLIREATAFLLDVLKTNLPEHGFLQTKVPIVL